VWQQCRHPFFVFAGTIAPLTGSITRIEARARRRGRRATKAAMPRRRKNAHAATHSEGGDNGQWRRKQPRAGRRRAARSGKPARPAKEKGGDRRPSFFIGGLRPPNPRAARSAGAPAPRFTSPARSLRLLASLLRADCVPQTPARVAARGPLRPAPLPRVRFAALAHLLLIRTASPKPPRGSFRWTCPSAILPNLRPSRMPFLQLTSPMPSHI
jgi:hypothetical protein